MAPNNDPMEVKKEEYYSFNELQGSLNSFLRHLRRKWLLLVLTILISAGVGYLIYLFQKPKYQATTTFILEEKSSQGGLAGLASQFGFNVGGMSGGGGLFAGDNILDILRSKTVVQKVLLSPSGDSLHSTSLADYFLDFSETRKKWKNDPRLATISFIPKGKRLSPVEDSVLNDIYEQFISKHLITERLTKQGTIIRVVVSERDALFARIMSKRLVEEASRLYLEIRTGTAQANISQLERRSDSLLSLLNRKSYVAAASQPLDINPGIRTATVPVEIASRDKTVLATLYAEVTKNLEASRLLLSQQTPVIQQLDSPGILLDDNKKGLGFLLAISVLAGSFLFVLGSFIVFFLKRINTQ